MEHNFSYFYLIKTQKKTSEDKINISCKLKKSKSFAVQKAKILINALVKIVERKERE